MKEIKKHIQTKELGNDVIFLNDRKDMNRIYQAMDVFIFPSLYEGLGIVAVEAQAAEYRLYVQKGCLQRQKSRLCIREYR